MNHTKGPWEVFEWDDRQSAIHFISVVSKLTGEMVASYLPIADAKRIVACVNACAWVTNEALDAGIVLDSIKLHGAILDQQPSSFFKEYGVKVWEDV
jgi:hypothetical protein